MAKETLAQRLRRLRHEQGLTMNDLAEPGVSASYICRIEEGTRTPSAKALVKLAAKLGVTPAELEHGRDLLAEARRQIEELTLEKAQLAAALATTLNDLAEARRTLMKAGLTTAETTLPEGSVVRPGHLDAS